MHEARLTLECKKPDAVAESIMHDAKEDSSSRVDVKIGEKSVTISIRSGKLGHLKAIVNTYISLVAALNDVEELK